MKQLITLPVPDELLNISEDTCSEVNVQDYCIDIASIKYDDPDLESNKVECSLIYLRNIDLPFPCDFSECTYEVKEEWILKYLESCLYDLCIKELNETILNILSDGPIDNLDCILTADEVIKFKEKNKDLINEILRFMVSLNLLLDYALINPERSKFSEVEADFDKDLEVVKEKPLYFEVLHLLLQKYPIVFDAIRLFYVDQIKPAKYEFILEQIDKNSLLYTEFLNLPSVTFFSLVLNKQEDGEDNNA